AKSPAVEAALGLSAGSGNPDVPAAPRSLKMRVVAMGGPLEFVTMSSDPSPVAFSAAMTSGYETVARDASEYGSEGSLLDAVAPAGWKTSLPWMVVRKGFESCS